MRVGSLRLGSAGAWLLAALLAASHSGAVTTLTVDLAAPIGPAKHVASGSLYGVTETLPANVDTFITPLRPRMFTNPAANQQQPVGDAIVVAGRVAASGATVTIRLADWFKGFYTFTSMSDWFTKIGQTVARRKAANLTNIYGYEIWNEPGGTWASSNPLSFNEFWRQTFVELRRLDPGVKIIGPSYAWYNQSFISSFLTFCKTNDCLPDIIAWHELGGGDVAANIRNYRALEKQLGISPLLISINEYSGAAHIDVEGQPGASAPLIAKFERLLVDSACISYWDVSHPGRLGSLMASNTQPNGGFWFYKWYGDMTGNMLSTTPPTPSSATALDGFANLDTSAASASVLFGGVNDGTISVVVKGFAAAQVFGTSVHAVVERTPFVNRTTVVTQTSTLSSADVTISNDQIAVSVTSANATDGYRLSLTPVGGGGANGAGGGSASGGSKSAGGSANGGTSSGGKSSATGGVSASGGGLSMGGAGSGGSASGGKSGTSGGASAGGSATMGGANATNGGAATAGSTATSGGTAAGGANATNGGASATSGGAFSAGGASSRGGTNAAGGARSGAGGAAGGDASESSGCSCRVGEPSHSARPASGALSAIALALAAARGRRRRRLPRG